MSIRGRIAWLSTSLVLFQSEIWRKRCFNLTIFTTLCFVMQSPNLTTRCGPRRMSINPYVHPPRASNVQIWSLRPISNPRGSPKSKSGQIWTSGTLGSWVRGGPQRPDMGLWGQICTLDTPGGRMDGWMDRFSPVLYRTSSPSGPLPCFYLTLHTRHLLTNIN